ncbi:hypothetical protein HGO26_11015 [Shewanella sp. S-1]|uniref:Uncharacterized protein n=1 Tax=Shewanella oncorhynchi TaxID=2726434 RepID=A0ABX1KQM1_9GAMM|nr:hypothetical protein [Shewanella oncorhynchi]NLQ23402.1 hypothetical protein [Shewanella oncorhynchi]
MSEKNQEQKIPVKPGSGSDQKRSDGGLGVDNVRNQKEIGNGKISIPHTPSDRKSR